MSSVNNYYYFYYYYYYYDECVSFRKSFISEKFHFEKVSFRKIFCVISQKFISQNFNK